MKINGKKIHLSEIELLLHSCKGVSHAVVLPVKNKKNLLIVAFIAGNTNKLIVKDFLKKKLDGYKHPNNIIILSDLPMTLSGKIDRVSLIREYKKLYLQDNKHTLKQSAVGNDIEKKLIKIYKNCLHINTIPISKTILELGGSSITILKIIMKIQKAFKIDLIPSDFGKNTSIKATASKINKKLISENSAKIKTASTINNKGIISTIFPFSKAQLRYWYRIKTEPSSAFNVAYSMQVEGKLDMNLFKRSIEQVLLRHHIFRVSIIEKEKIPYHALNLNKESLCKVSFNDLQKLSSIKKTQRLKSYEKIISNYVFDFEKESLFKMKICKLSPLNHVFFYIAHHLIIDSWSHEIMLNEMWFIYKNLVKENKIPTMSDPIQYKDYVNWENKMIEKLETKKRLKFWKGVLKEQFFSFKNPIKTALRNDNFVHSFSFTQQQKNTILNYSINNNLSVFLISFALFNIVFCALSKKLDFCSTIDITTREHHQFDKTIGLFTNVLPVCIKLIKELSIKENIKNISKFYKESIKNQLPLEMLVRKIFPGQLGYYDKIFPVAFIFQNHYRNIPFVPNLNITYRETLDLKISRDLIFEVISGKLIKINIYYKSNKYDFEKIKKIAENYQKALDFLGTAFLSDLSKLFGEIK